MDFSIIEVPDMNDSISRIVLAGRQYLLRFTYNDTGDYWCFGLADALGNVILSGVKIVPSFPLNLFYSTTEMPAGVFGVLTELDRVGRSDFKDGKAKFIFCPTN